MILDM